MVVCSRHLPGDVSMVPCPLKCSPVVCCTSLKCAHGSMPMALCLWLYAHGGVLMEWWCLAIIIADKELLQNIADISPVMCLWLHAPDISPVVCSW